MRGALPGGPELARDAGHAEEIVARGGGQRRRFDLAQHEEALSCRQELDYTGDGSRRISPMAKYVAGFLFCPSRQSVALVRKNRPAFQAGLLNAVGGKIEEGETPEQAMVREFREEAGMSVPEWREEAFLVGGNFEVTFFSAVSPIIDEVRTMTDEPIEVHPVADVLLRRIPVMRNLPLLVAACLDESGIVRPIMLIDGLPQ
jgi:8-oxo-dGTP diphosphatase